MPIPKKSRTKVELIPSVIVEFYDLADYYWTLDQWKENGSYKGFLKSHEISPRKVKKVHRLLLNPDDFPSNAWEG